MGDLLPIEENTFTDLLKGAFQSTVLQSRVLSLYSCGGVQHLAFAIWSMPPFKPADFLHSPLKYFPDEQFAHPG